MASGQYRAIAGLAILAGATVIVFGFITAAALFPGYSMADDTISALGADEGTAESNLVFNGAMVLGGVLTLIGAYGLHRVYDHALLTTVFAVTAVVGYIGVGVFPAQTGAPHAVAAFVAFGGTGISALVVATVIEGPYQLVSGVLGVAELVALLAFVVVGASNPLGLGGLERWVAYFGVVWAMGFGGFLLSPAASTPGWSGLK